MPFISDHELASKRHNHIDELVRTWFDERDNPSLDIDYGVIASYIGAVCHPSDPTDSTWNLYNQILETRIGYAPQGLLSRLLQCKCDAKQDSECMSVLFSLLISGFLPPTEDQRRSIKRVLYTEDAHELTNHILDDKEIGPMLEDRLQEMEESNNYVHWSGF